VYQVLTSGLEASYCALLGNNHWTVTERTDDLKPSQNQTISRMSR